MPEEDVDLEPAIPVVYDGCRRAIMTQFAATPGLRRVSEVDLLRFKAEREAAARAGHRTFWFFDQTWVVEYADLLIAYYEGSSNVVVELEKGVWLASWAGDPGRTLDLSSAKQFKNDHGARCALGMARKFRPFGRARIYRPDEGRAHKPAVSISAQP